MTCATARILLAATLLLGACPAGEDTPDAGGGNPDGNPGTAALSFELSTSPDVPATVGAVQVDELRVWLRDVRAIGDSAPGDERTSVAELELDWRSGRPLTTVRFPSAPPGVYARLDARLGQPGDDEKAWELRGRVTRTDGVFELELEGESSLSLSVSLDALVLGATARTARVTLALDFLEDVDWQSLPVDGDRIRLDEDGPTAQALSAAIAAGFALEDVRDE
jgi:hypothetical protein